MRTHVTILKQLSNTQVLEWLALKVICSMGTSWTQTTKVSKNDPPDSGLPGGGMMPTPQWSILYATRAFQLPDNAKNNVS